MICETIKSMEQGQFQCFCLDLLPIYDSRYKGLKRFGHTAEGKTRKGTPDLIKILEDGKVIAVECSTKKNYWKQQKEIRNWKPCNDINKCIGKFKNDLKEIILCSNQEQPTNKPNIFSEIIEFAKSKTSAVVKIFDCVQIENIVSVSIQKPLFKSIYKEYFPEIYEIEYNKVLDNKKSIEEGFKKIINELIKNKSFLLKKEESIEGTKYQREPLFRLIYENYSPDLSQTEHGKLFEKQFFEEAIKNLISKEIGNKSFSLTKEISVEKTKYQRETLPFSGEITRIVPNNFPILKPVGSIHTVLGVPKIGKTSLVAGFTNQLQKEQMEIKWYDCPPDKDGINEVINVIFLNICKKFLSLDKFLELKENQISIYSLEKIFIKKEPQTPTIYVIDNAEFLLNEGKPILKVCEILEKIKSLDLLPNLGFIFISNRSLKNDCSLMSKEANAPFWTKKEILEILTLKIPDSEYYRNNSYIDIIMTKSYGHPLIALALTKKYKTLSDLLLSIIKIDSFVDEELEAEVKKLLFEDILENNDFKNFIIRLSPFIYPFTEEICELISNKIRPIISYPINLIIDKLTGTVLEGSKKGGYRIAGIYKSVAQQYLNNELRNEIFEVVSNKLLTPDGKILDADRTISGIIYAFLARKIESAFYWTIVLLQSMSKQELSKIEREHIVARLEPISFWNPSKELKLLIQYYTVLISMSMAYANIENNKKAIELLNKIKMPSENITNKKLKESFLFAVKGAKYHKMLLYAKENDMKNLLETLNDLDFNFMKNILPGKDSNMILFFKESIPVISIKQIPASLIKKIINSVDLRSEQDIANLIFIASHLGIGIDKENINIKEFIKFLPLDNSMSEIIKNIIKAQFAFQKQNDEESLKQLDISISLCKKKRLWNKSVKSVISQMQGDSFYRLHDNRNAKKAYLKYLRYFHKYSKKDFINGFVKYRLGLLSDNSKKAVKYFKESSIIFNRYRDEDLYARSEGERGIAFVQLDQPYKFVRIAEWMIKRYFLRNRLRVGPAVSMVLAQLIRIQSDLENTPLIETKEKIYPKFERGVYNRASIEAKPQGTGIMAFYSLASTYSLLGYTDRKIKSLRIALNFKPTNLIDFNSKALASNELLMEIVQSGSLKEISNIIMEIILIEPERVRGGIQNLSLCAFRAIDKSISFLENSRKEELIKLFTKIESYLKESQNTNLDWWLAEIYLIEAKLSVDIYKKSQQYSYWSKAYKHGIKSSNQNVIIESAHSLSFVYAEFSESIKNLAEIQFSIIKGISSQDCNFERLENIGINLFNGWNNLDWRRLSTDDLKAKHTLMDGAKELKKTNYNAQEASPIMILLLCSVFDFKDKITEWVKNLIQKDKIDTIPSFVREQIMKYL